VTIGRIVLAAAALTAAAGIQASSAAPTAFITVRAGDIIDVVGTKVVCAVSGNLVYCYHSRLGKPIAKTFAAAIYTTRQAALFRIGASGKGALVARRPLAAGAATRVVKLRVGQATRLQGTRLDCAAVRSEGRPTIYCSNDDAVGPTPGTHAVLVNDKLAAIGRVAKSRETTIVVLRQQPQPKRSAK